MEGVYVIYGLNDNGDDAYCSGVFKTLKEALANLAELEGEGLGFLETFKFEGLECDYNELFDTTDLEERLEGKDEETKNMFRNFASDKNNETFEKLIYYLDELIFEDENKNEFSFLESFLVDDWEKKIGNIMMPDNAGYIYLEYHTF